MLFSREDERDIARGLEQARAAGVPDVEIRRVLAEETEHADELSGIVAAARLFTLAQLAREGLAGRVVSARTEAYHSSGGRRDAQLPSACRRPRA
jgi:hypothetical protein